VAAAAGQVNNSNLVAAYLSEGFPPGIENDFEVFPTGFMSPRVFLFRKVRPPLVLWRCRTQCAPRICAAALKCLFNCVLSLRLVLALACTLTGNGIGAREQQRGTSHRWTVRTVADGAVAGGGPLTLHLP